MTEDRGGVTEDRGGTTTVRSAVTEDRGGTRCNDRVWRWRDRGSRWDDLVSRGQTLRAAGNDSFPAARRVWPRETRDDRGSSIILLPSRFCPQRRSIPTRLTALLLPPPPWRFFLENSPLAGPNSGVPRVELTFDLAMPCATS